MDTFLILTEFCVATGWYLEGLEGEGFPREGLDYTLKSNQPINNVHTEGKKRLSNVACEHRQTSSFCFTLTKNQKPEIHLLL